MFVGCLQARASLPYQRPRVARYYCERRPGRSLLVGYSINERYLCEFSQFSTDHRFTTGYNSTFVNSEWCFDWKWGPQITTRLTTSKVTTQVACRIIHHFNVSKALTKKQLWIRQPRKQFPCSSRRYPRLLPPIYQLIIAASKIFRLNELTRYNP